LKELPNSSHGEDRIDDDETGEIGPTNRSVDIFQPEAGSYSVLVSGLKLGTFALTVIPFAQDNSPQPRLSLPGIAGPGSTSTFQIQYSPAPGASVTTVRLAMFESTVGDISNSLQLDLIDNRGIANSLSQKLNAAASAAAQGDSQTASNILRAFQAEVNAQNGKHITGIALQVLLEDADSLIAQMPH